jgi:NAD(P)-dependent dehydrogenase (short-subunit alcohol dehydrogenase family)
MSRLAGKVAFITGGGSGIGRATAERFAEEGAKVVVADIDVAAGEATARLARTAGANSGGDAHFVRCDVTERAGVEAAVSQTVTRYGKLDILHNNAGGSTLQAGRSPRRRTKSSGASSGSISTAPSCAARSPFPRSSRRAGAR